MSAPQAPQRGGGIGVLFLFAIVIGGAGLAFDLILNHERAFWIGAEPGARAVLGAVAGIAVVAAGHLMRLVLGRAENRTEGSGDGDQP